MELDEIMVATIRELLEITSDNKELQKQFSETLLSLKNGKLVLSIEEKQIILKTEITAQS